MDVVDGVNGTDTAPVAPRGRLARQESARAAPPAPPAGQGRAVADFADPKVPLEGDPLWADVTPIPQDEGPSPVTPIMYPPECACSAPVDERRCSALAQLRSVLTLIALRCLVVLRCGSHGNDELLPRDSSVR